MPLNDVLSRIIRAPARRPFHFAISRDRVLAPPAVPGKFTPHGSYVEVRLAQMYLQDRRQYWRDFFPIICGTGELTFDGARPAASAVSKQS